MNKDNGPTLTKHELMLRVNRATKITQPDALKAIDLIFDEISKTLVSGGHCEFRDFGVFQLVTRKPRVGRNPHKPEDTFDIPERRVVKFKASRKLRADLSAKI